MNRTIDNRPLAARVAALTVVALLLLWLAPATRLAAQAAGATPAQPPGFLNFPMFNAPPFDFNDAFYTANGINLTELDTAAAARFASSCSRTLTFIWSISASTLSRFLALGSRAR